ncbi:MAG: hypothetical protein WKF37_22175, partial [Bryobacteraceae bacterium]
MPILKTSLHIPGAKLVKVYSGLFDRHVDGTVAVAGSAIGYDFKSANFIAVILANGQHQSIIPVSPFNPHAIAFAADGTIWAAGQELLDGDAPILRRFDRAGRMLHSFLRPSELKSSKAVPHPASVSHLMSIGDRL